MTLRKFAIALGMASIAGTALAADNPALKAISNGKLIAGGLVGLIALAILVVGAVMLFKAFIIFKNKNEDENDRSSGSQAGAWKLIGYGTLAFLISAIPGYVAMSLLGEKPAEMEVISKTGIAP